MADVKKCDCCGAIYHDYESWSCSLMYHKTKESGPYEKQIDMCPKCGVKIMLAINGLKKPTED